MTEICDNCGAPIGKLETPMIFDDHVVCGSCYLKLKPPAETLSESDIVAVVPASRFSSPSDPLDQLAQAARRSNQTLVYAPQYAPDPPRVQLIEQTSKKWKGQMAVAALLMCLGFPLMCALPPLGLVIVAFGFFWLVIARSMAWWEHG